MCKSNYHLDLFFILHYIVLYCTALHCFILLCLAFRRVCIAKIHNLSFDLYCTERKRLIIQCSRHITSLRFLLYLIYLSPDDFRTSDNSINLLYYIKRMLSPKLFFFLDVCVWVSVSVYLYLYLSFFVSVYVCNCMCMYVCVCMYVPIPLFLAFVCVGMFFVFHL